MAAQDTLEVIWGVRLLDEGFVAIPNIIVRNYRKLGIEHGEFGLLCTILTFKHDMRAPYPTHETLARHLGCGVRQVRKWVDSLETKNLLRIGRRRKAEDKTFGAMVYNFKPLIDVALQMVGETPLPESKDEWEIEYRNPVEPEVPLALPDLQVPVGPAELQDPDPADPEGPNFGPEGPLNISLNRSKDDDLLRARARGNSQNVPDVQHEFDVPEPSYLHDTLDDSDHFAATNDFAWKESAPLVAYEAWNETAASLPSELTLPETIPSLSLSAPIESTTPAPSAMSAANEGLPASPTLNDVCDAVDRRMAYHRGYWTIAKQGDYHAIVSLLAEGIPGEFLLSGIDYTFQHFSDKKPSSFSYCAKIIKQLWANEREKLASPESIDVSTYPQPTQRRPSRQIRNSLGSAGQKSERDERYSAFYELFPDA